MNLPDTPNLTEPFCPGCSPERDQVRELLIVRWCDTHEPSRSGADDDRATTSSALLNTAGEAEGADCKLYADLIHRRRTA